MALKVMSYSEATRLLSALKNVKRHIGYFNQIMIDLPKMESDLDLCIRDVSLYRQYIKR